MATGWMLIDRFTFSQNNWIEYQISNDHLPEAVLSKLNY